ncbi:response regulator transcription factor [Listeria ilorinensis]|uniref:response regulator transcription factor n=1 Tax=Listeria ilorinensis TaxID=2867439 RepID=UPI001EF4690A|nr:response regulator transcription factor [Listeria ilorinensis]
MLKILLVDDEPLILKGLEHIIPDLLPTAQIIGKAPNGRFALENYADTQVDVLITDIKMPEMDGLELIAEWQQIQPETKMIVLSGFEEFQFIKQGLALGIENYLLKPLNEEELKETLTQIGEKIEKQHSGFEEEAYFILRDNTIWRWLEGRIDEVEWLERMELYQMAFLEETESVLALIERTSDLPSSKWKKLERQLRQQYPLMLVNPESQILVGIRRMEHLPTELLALYDQISETLDQPDFYLFLSEPVTNEKHFPAALRQIQRLLPERLIQKPGSLISLQKRTKQTWRPKRRQHQIAKLLLLEDDTEMQAWIHAFFAEWREHLPESDPHQILHILNELILMMAESDPKELAESMRLLAEQKTIGGLEQAVLTITLRYNQRKKEETSGSSPIIQKVISYVAEHFAEGMSLKTLGNDFHINAVYLGQLFQKEKGEHFTDYLNRYRINFAKEQLVQTEAPLKIIAEHSGYTDMAYFYRQFKKYTGKTPNQFRKAWQNSHTF